MCLIRKDLLLKNLCMIYLMKVILHIRKVEQVKMMKVSSTLLAKVAPKKSWFLQKKRKFRGQNQALNLPCFHKKIPEIMARSKLPRKWRHSPSYPSKYIIRDLLEGRRTESFFYKHDPYGFHVTNCA